MFSQEGVPKAKKRAEAPGSGEEPLCERAASIGLSVLLSVADSFAGKSLVSGVRGRGAVIYSNISLRCRSKSEEASEGSWFRASTYFELCGSSPGGCIQVSCRCKRPNRATICMCSEPLRG